MYRLTRLFLLCVFVSTLVFAQPIPTIDWISPTESAMLHFDSGKWWFDGPSSPDSMFRVNFHDYSELDSSSLWIKISRNGAPLEEITGYYSHFYYDNGDAEGSFGLLGLEPGSYYDLCAHIANIYEMDTIQCVHFYTETVMDSCPPVVIGWNPEPEITCYDGYMSIMICDNSLDCSEITDVDPASVQLMLQIPGHPEMNVTSHTYIHNSGGPHCVEVDFNPTYPCDSLNYLIQPDMNIQFCVTASDYAGNAMPEPVCAFYNVCPDTCPPEVFNPYLSDTMLVFDGTWHISAGDSLWTINFNDNYSECIPTPFDTSTIGLLIRNCDDTSWRFVQATHINIVLDPAYCRLMGTASGSFDDLGLECGHCYEIMAQAGDMYGNIATGYSPVRFHTEECLPDSCDPFVAEWNPFPYDTNCFPYEDEIWFIVEDPSTEFCSCTGVHYVDASLLNNGTTFFLTGTSGLNRIDLGPCLAKFILDPAYYELVPGTGATLTVHGYDGAGGMFWDSLTFTVCDTFTPPVDTCPPYVERWMPNDTACIPVDANIGAMVCDNAPGCDNAGIIPDSITVLVRIGDDTAMTDITEQCYFDPAGDCIMVNWNHTGAAFSYDEDIQLCILAIDNAGNEFYDCNYWHTCALEDTCPPEVSWTTPAEGETLIFDSGQWFADREAYVDSNFNVNFYEFGCPGTGLVDSSLFIRIRACDDTVWTYILDYGIFSSWDYGNASGSFDLLGLEPAHCYIVCAAIMDGAGNWGDDCVTFYTEPVLEDTCPPYVTYWEPFDGDTVDTLAYIRAAYLVDPSSPECIYSGVDTSTYSMIVIINGDTLNVTSELTIYYDEVSWHHDSTPFPPGAHIVVCLDFADYAGNWAHDCIEFEVAGEAPVDECPPVVDIEYPPTGHCIPPDSGHIILDIFDPSDSICFASGVNETTIVVTTLIGSTNVNITDDCDISNTGFGGVRVNWFYTGLPETTLITICVSAADNAGNSSDPPICFEWTTCGGEIVDECPPVVVNWHPADGDTFCFEGDIWLDIVDPVDTMECPVCSGIDSLAVIMEVTHSDSDTNLYILSNGFGFWLDYGDSCEAVVILDNAYYTLQYGDNVALCVDMYDGADNYGSDCVYFTVCDTATPSDTCPPVFLGWLPDSCLPIYGNFEVHIDDPVDSLDCPFASGVSRTDFSVIVYFDSETLDVSEECTITNIGYSGMAISWGPAAFAYPPDEDITVCVEVIDNAGNTASECHIYHTCAVADTCPPEVGWTVPADGETLIFDSGQWFSNRGVYADSSFEVYFEEFGCPGTGLIDSSLFIRIRACDDTAWNYISDYDSYFSWDYGNGYGNLNSLGLEPGNCYIVCAAIMDGAGNWGDDCVTFYTEAADEDTCPPNVMWSVPSAEVVETLYYDSGHWHTVLGDMEFDLNLIEYGCPPTGIDTYNIYLAPCGGAPELIDDYDSYDGPDYVYAGDSFNSLGLLPGQCYTLCADVVDGAGNTNEGCVTFYTAETESIDLCPPVVTSWFPAGDTCLPIDAGLGLMLTDPIGDGCPIVTGVDSSSIVVNLTIGSDTTIDITSHCHIYSYGMYVGVEWAHSTFALPEGTDIMLCVASADYAGNWMDSCYTWTTCGEPETLDICPPIVEFYYPDTAECMPVDDIVEMFVYDNNDTGCYVSGLDSSSIIVMFSSGGSTPENVTDECTIYGSSYYGYAVNWDYSGLEPGANVRLCISAADFAGNHIYPPQCFSWTVCVEETTDICPPYVSWTSIYDGDSLVPLSAFIGFDLDDPIDDSMCLACTGIDTDSVVLTLISETDTMEFTIGAGLTFEPYECGGYAMLDTGMFELESGTEYTLCIDAADNAGNEMTTYCITFFTVSDTVVDIWPPCFDDWTPTMGDTSVPVDATIGVSICDVCSGAEAYTGVDSVYAEIWAFSHGETLLVDFDMELAPIYCAGYYVTLEPIDGLPECAHIYVEISAWDNAGNMSTDNIVFSTYCSPETTDIWDPCVSGVWPEPGDTIGTHTDVGVSFCDICEGSEFATGVDSSTITMTVDGDDVSDELLFYEIDCYGWAINWESDALPIGNHEICASASDYAGNTVDTCWTFSVFYDTTYEFDMLEPLDETWVNNPNKRIIGYFVDGPIPPDFSFDVNGTEYNFSSPEVVLSGDTLYFTPSAPWVDGESICYHIADESGCFSIDLTPPEIEFLEPSCGDTLSDSPSMIEIGITDTLSGVDETTIGAQISTSMHSWNFHVGMTGVNWDGTNLTIDLATLGLELGGNVSVYAWAGDSPDYTFDLSDTIMSNYNFETCTFRVTPVIMATIAGSVTDVATSLPVPGAHVIILPYIHGWPIWLYPGSFGPLAILTTDADGFFSADMGPGRWMVAMKPPVGPMIFWDGHRFPLAADPVRINALSPDTIWCNFDAGIMSPDLMEHHQVSGTVYDSDGLPVIRSFVVVISTDDDDEEELSISADMTDSLGLFSCPVRNGTYWVSAFKPAYFPTYLGNKWNWQNGDTVYVSGTDLTDVDVTLYSLSDAVGPNTVWGTVYEVDTLSVTTPMRGAVVYLNEPISHECKFAGVSDYEGNYEIDNVSDGVYKLVADMPYYLPQGGWETVNASDGAEHDIYLQRRIEGIDENVKMPEIVSIINVRPNPFNTSAEIEFLIPTNGEVSLEIVDVMGHTIAKLFDGTVSQGRYIAIWNGEEHTSGIYFAKLHFGDRTITTKLLLTK